MKIVLISQYFYPEQFSNNSIAKNMVERGHEVEVVACVPNYPQGAFFDGYSNSTRRSEIWEGVRVFRARTAARGTRTWHLALNYLTYPIMASFTLWRKTSKDADISFVSMPSPLFQAFAGVFLRRIRKVPTVYWVQDIWPESAVFTLGLKSPWIVKPLEAVCGWLYRRADLILVQSEAFPPMIERFGVPAEKIRVLANTAPDTYRVLDPADAPEQAKLVPQTGFRVMFAGNIGESQNFDMLIDAADRLKGHDISWVIIGSGRDADRAKSRIAELKLQDKFLFLGRFPEEDMPKFFTHADALIVSLKDSEIFRLTVPYKIQCYMACGKPIIACVRGEGARVVEAAEAGYAVSDISVDSLSATVLKMAKTSPAERAKLGRNARQYFEQTYAPDIIYGNLETWLREAADSKQH